MNNIVLYLIVDVNEGDLHLNDFWCYVYYKEIVI